MLTRTLPLALPDLATVETLVQPPPVDRRQPITGKNQHEACGEMQGKTGDWGPMLASSPYWTNFPNDGDAFDYALSDCSKSSIGHSAGFGGVPEKDEWVSLAVPAR